MTKGTREARMKARMERQMFENSQNKPKKQFAKDNRRSVDNKDKNIEIVETEIREDLIVDKND